MIKLTVTVKTSNGKNINDLYTAVIDKISNGFKDELLDIGIVFLREIDLNFLAGGRPDTWQVSQAAIDRGGMTLVDRGLLRASVTSQGAVNGIFEVYDLELIIGSKMPYALYMYEGTERNGKQTNPPRPFLIISSDALIIAGDILAQGISAYL